LNFVAATSFDPMDRLPKVLQNEIWEYVRGDKTFWRQSFKCAIYDLDWTGHSVPIQIKSINGQFDVQLVHEERPKTFAVIIFKNRRLVTDVVHDDEAYSVATCSRREDAKRALNFIVALVRLELPNLRSSAIIRKLQRHRHDPSRWESTYF
jgi:hypothetical protein